MSLCNNPQPATALSDVIGEIERPRADGRDVLVHCHRGQSRTGLVLRAWLQQVEGLSHGEALRRVPEIDGRFAPCNKRFESVFFERDLDEMTG